ncbi:F0F1 ATP synthase subunit epsilon [Hymenobacter siberiensis]|jgi:F-type H+-transporting ATPase subunit epsilon|uniref:F0F1 ATP synthase subunit epsilon n=2 Tax=Hymenobacter siberiensis TaxID=2848396 RepID=UPI001C1E3CF8|nr:F0F1 ATP synthase subunit epsilon [Hymenobacter siberiensis]MBU6123277.1 F0F1 ATP synthase subunit epsilon [Hymenobacter siberiensis]
MSTMNLKVLLPFRVFLDIGQISRIVLETSAGAYGLLPRRLDCVAALVPGIFTYETADGRVHYLAVDEGVLLKAGPDVSVSVRNAIGGVGLGQLRELVEQDFRRHDAEEQAARTTLRKIETGLLTRLETLQQS